MYGIIVYILCFERCGYLFITIFTWWAYFDIYLLYVSICLSIRFFREEK